MKSLTVVTFDLDNTLWDVNAVIRAAERDMRSWLLQHAPAIGALEQSGRWSEAWLAARREVLAQQPQIGHNVTAMRLAVLLRLLVRCGYREREARSLAQHAFDVFLDTRHKIVYFDGALDMLDALARVYRIGALSNGNADVMRLGLNDIFKFKFSAADVGAEKPSPEMFQAALAHADVAPAQMVHVGDHPLDDIEGAGRLGIATVWVNFAGAEYPADYIRPTITVRRLEEIPQRLRQYRDENS
jgi:FMN hydrolase / 5-amino-6-(5-phospho-D-ribitylamino)uracil phosphatase